jgi:Flp pilus assembly protein TadG
MKLGDTRESAAVEAGARTGQPLSIARVGDQCGAELVEAALVIPLLVTLLLGIVWLSRAYNIYATITRAAREGARVAVLPSCATCGNSLPADADIRGMVDPALSASGLQPLAVRNFLVERKVSNPSDPLSDTQVTVSFSYPVSLSIPLLPLELTTFDISTHVQMRGEEKE